MRPALSKYVKETLIFLGTALVVALLLPALGVAAFALRLVLIVAIPVAVLAVVMSPAVRSWFTLEAGRAELGSYFGLRVPDRVALHPTHSWADLAGGNDVTVGVDDLVQRVVGPVEEVRLPQVGDRVHQGDRLFEIRRGRRKVSVKAPLSGEVVGINERLAAIPWLLNRSPYGAGWAVKIRPRRSLAERRRLLRADRARIWFRNEVDRLVELVSPGLLATSTAQDGGLLVDEFHDTIGDRIWRRVHRTFFGAV